MKEFFKERTRICQCVGANFLNSSTSDNRGNRLLDRYLDIDRFVLRFMKLVDLSRLQLLDLCPIRTFIVLILLHHGCSMNTDQADRAKELMTIMRKKLDAQIPRPNKRVFNSKCLHLTGIPRLIDTQLLPLIRFSRISIRDTNTERVEDGAEELIIRKDDRVNKDIIAKLQ